MFFRASAKHPAATSGGRVSIVKWGSGVAKIASGKKTAALQRFGGAAHQDAIHDDVAARREIGSDKLMLCRNVREQNIVAARKVYGFALTQVGQSDESVVSRIEPQDAAL